ncbi:YueI family protein [Metabacillus malikii]|uniref:Uncharacterized protein YueI n=1 Tax=Metabacillus malikii TaxID=1504265 RepID=A0ABT9ZCL8_9BACI|nr:YueI family protein [Metabacillus malikii]MDQ0229996.1 uncharacterized protein YueI [Metabacillus malikii]
MSDKLDEYVQQGIHGVREINPDERRLYLGTLRERVIVVLTKEQVREKGTYIEIEKRMKESKDATLYLNGNMNYQYLSDYIKLANKLNIKYTISTNKEYNSKYGLVLAEQEAINTDNITISKGNNSQIEGKKAESGLKRLLKKLL